MKQKKKKLKKKGFIVIVLALYLAIMAFYYVYKMPVKNVIVKGNNIVSDTEIIKLAGMDNTTKLFFLNKGKVLNDIKSNPVIKNVVLKRNFNGDATIIVEENKVLFYNQLNKTYVLSNNQEIENIDNILGIPVLINYVPSEVYSGLIAKMSDVEDNIIKHISEIEYSPLQIMDKDKDEYVTVDSERFLLRMNDGNYVYINLPNFEKLSRYEQYYVTIGDNKKGIFELDSKSDNVIHKLFEEEKNEGEVDELPQ